MLFSAITIVQREMHFFVILDQISGGMKKKIVYLASHLILITEYNYILWLI